MTHMNGLRFYNAASAVNWAEEWTTRPELGSQFSRLLKAPGGGNIPYTDLKDAAHTISLITAECKPYSGELMKLIYGRCAAIRMLGVAEMFAGRLAKTDPGGQFDGECLIRVGIMVIKEARCKKMYGRRYPARLMADDLGINRSNLYKSKRRLVLLNQARGMIRFMENAASVEIEAELEQLGWIA